MITKRVISDLVALAHDAQAAAETLANRIEVVAERGGVSKAALRRVVMACAKGDVEKLEREVLSIADLIAHRSNFDDFSDPVSIPPVKEPPAA